MRSRCLRSANCTWVALSIVFLQCQTKTYVYQRNASGINEKLEINLKSEVFLYKADSTTQTYSIKGKLEIVHSNVYLEFPENAERQLLSPFKKGYYELTKIAESRQVEIEIVCYDVRTKVKLSRNRHFNPVMEILTLQDSSLVRVVPASVIQLPDIEAEVWLRSKVNGYFEQYILIKAKGKYRLNLYLQPLQTIETYETTKRECNRVVSGPLLWLRADGLENQSIKSLIPVGESHIPYSGIETPYNLVVIEKRKMRLF